MNFTKTILAAALAVASTGAMAAPEAFTNDGAAQFIMYDKVGGVAGDFYDVTGFVDYAAGTFGVASVSPFFGDLWTASGGTLYTPGTYTVDVNGDGANTTTAVTTAGGNLVTFTVGAGQMGGNIDFAWGGNEGIDVFMVWNVTDLGNGTKSWVSTDMDGSGFAGNKMIDGPFKGFEANFNFTTPVPEASTYGMMLAGLGLVGFAVRRRKLMA